MSRNDHPIGEQLDRARNELLDLPARSRLHGVPRSGKTTRGVEIVDERNPEVSRMPVRENRSSASVAGKAASDGAAEDAEADEVIDPARPEDDHRDERGVFGRHADTRPQTA